MLRFPLTSLAFGILCCSGSFAFEVSKTATPPIIDGLNTDSVWQNATWKPFNTVIIGGDLSAQDFSANYRVLWDESSLYIQVDIVDDILYDNNPNPLEGYWSDDCLEIFIDADASGGDHQYNHNAFAYHIALDNQVVDLTPQKQAALYNSHVTSRWQRQSASPYNIIWEAAVKVFDDEFDESISYSPDTLAVGKKIGFMLAYCDNDGSQNREHFIGSKDIEPVNGDKNRGWIDASVFDTITLIE